MVVGIDIGAYKAVIAVVSRGGIDVLMNNVSKRTTEYVYRCTVMMVMVNMVVPSCVYQHGICREHTMYQVTERCYTCDICCYNV